MSISLTVGGKSGDGIGDLMHKLEQMEKNIIAAAVDVMGDVVEIVKEASIENSPVDTEDLENCHETSVHAFKNINKVVGLVYIDDSKMNNDHDGMQTSEYAILMHEYLAPYGSGYYHLGPKSLAKKNSGKDVGGKFLLRALEANRKKIVGLISSRMEKIIEDSLK